jgi:ABC-type multidrug transport system fused ATPase/permease subunit
MQVGAFIHHLTTFITGFTIAFVKGWDMALVMLGCLPFLGLVAGAVVQITMGATKKVQESYSKVRLEPRPASVRQGAAAGRGTVHAMVGVAGSSPSKS